MPTLAAKRAGRGRAHRALQVMAGWAVRLRECAPHPVRWLLTKPDRLVMLAWLVGLLIAGHARVALAQDIIVGPDLAHGSAKTLFETYGFIDYPLTVKPDDASSGWLDVSKAVWEVIGVLNLLLLWLCLGILYGALTLLEWLLNLTIYADSAGQVDQAVQMVADTVFWPLITATVAIGAFATYARWRGEGRGFASDLGWVVAAAAMAIAFASGPAHIMSTVDSARQEMASGIIAGSSRFVNTAGNPTGFLTPSIGGSAQEVGTRKLVDGMWNTFGATPWCYAQFKSLEVCRAAGSHALANDDTWRRWMQVLDDQGSVPEFGPYGDYIRGQAISRLGILLMLALIAIPIGLLLLRLVIAGLTAAVGLLLMLCIGMVFLVLWPIPGWPRTVGTRYVAYTLGMELQALFITATTSGVMVTSTVIATLTGKYGFFVVALLNLALLNAASRMRSWLDTLLTADGARSMGIASILVMRSLARTIGKATAAIASSGTSLAAGAASAAGKAGMRTVSGGLNTGSASTRMRRMADLDIGGSPVQATATRTAPGTGLATASTPGGMRSTGKRHSSGGQRRPGTDWAPGRRVYEPVRAINGRPAPPPKQSTGPSPPAPDTPKSGTTFEARTARTQHGRIWVVPPGGRRLAPPDKTPPPPTRAAGGVHKITNARPPRRRGRRS